MAGKMVEKKIRSALPLYIAAAINRIMESHSASSSKEM